MFGGWFKQTFCPSTISWNSRITLCNSVCLCGILFYIDTAAVEMWYSTSWYLFGYEQYVLYQYTTYMPIMSVKKIGLSLLVLAVSQIIVTGMWIFAKISTSSNVEILSSPEERFLSWKNKNILQIEMSHHYSWKIRLSDAGKQIFFVSVPQQVIFKRK